MTVVKIFVMTFLVINLPINSMCSQESRALRWESLFSDQQSQGFDEQKRSTPVLDEVVQLTQSDDATVLSARSSEHSIESDYSLTDWQDYCDSLKHHVDQRAQMQLSPKAISLYLELLDNNPAEAAIIQALQAQKLTQSAVSDKTSSVKKNDSCSVS